MNIKKIFKYLLIISLLFLPRIVLASGVTELDDLPGYIVTEVAITILSSLFLLRPIAKLIMKEKSLLFFILLFFIRIILIILGFMFNPLATIGLDFLIVIIGEVFVWKKTIETKPTVSPKVNTEAFKKAEELSYDSEDGVINESLLERDADLVHTVSNKTVSYDDFDSIFALKESDMVEAFLEREIVKVGIDLNAHIISKDALKRKTILSCIFSLLLCIYITLIFFHFPLYTYLIGAVILFIFFKVTNKYTFMKYLKQQLVARPQEKVSNIIMSEKLNLVNDISRIVFFVGLAIAIVLPAIIFYKPRILYERTDGGYAVRYYAFGLTNFKTAEIPETYKGEKVVSLRGNTFSNMPYLEKVSLPDSITEIRGQAFKNCRKLVSVNMPKELQYLGGGAFYNAKSLRSIEFYDNLTYMGGEAFYNAESLSQVKLSKNLSEIRGDTFEYCTSLMSITIPDKVTRIGGHAFYGDYLLREVNISENSKLQEIGSSAFRECTSLYSIKVPLSTVINERAFKNSPTKVLRYGSY